MQGLIYYRSPLYQGPITTNLTYYYGTLLMDLLSISTNLVSKSYLFCHFLVSKRYPIDTK